jgi:hypothetical protein
VLTLNGSVRASDPNDIDPTIKTSQQNLQYCLPLDPGPISN